ncbi:MAG: hypothetical protein HC915_03925 [Anaerolineae bacterium]|nr:hypothetical protein [Anaerolineae bacterium]
MADNDFGTKLSEAVLSSSALRENLTDDEAQPLVDWGVAQAEQVGAQMGDLLPMQQAMALEEKQTALLKLLTRITWVAVHSANKGEAWTRKTLAQINEYEQVLYGPAAPQLNAELMDRIALGQAGYNQGELVLTLIQALSPEEDISNGEKT